jgi:ribonucleotide monophosphatase NagD (HAD superfamily)
VAPGQAFDVLIIADESGFPFLETVDTVLSGLFNTIDHRQEIHLVLPNPDLIYPKDNHGFSVGSGSIAMIFEAAIRIRYLHQTDLTFIPLGKPEQGLFEEAFHRCGTNNLVMIGGQIETDIRGACTFRIDSVLFNSGLTDTYIEALPARSRPTHLLDFF